MEIDKQMLKQLALTMERKVMTDEIRAIEKQLRTLGKKLNSLNETVEIDGDVMVIHAAMDSQIIELKKVLKANELL